MWIALNRAFLSIVQPTQRDYARYLDSLACPPTDYPNSAKHVLAVRSRSKADLIAAIGATCRLAGFEAAARIVEWPCRDYPARIMLPRDFVANLVAASIRSIGYENFKDSVKSNPLHDAYMDVWSAMNRYGRGHYDPKPKRDAGGRVRSREGVRKVRAQPMTAAENERHNRDTQETLDPYGHDHSWPGFLDLAAR